MSDEPQGHSDWAGEDLKPGKRPDKDEHPEIKDRPQDEEPPHRPHPQHPDQDAD